MSGDTTSPEPGESPLLTFEQSRGLERRRVEVYADSVGVTWRTPIQRQRFRVRFEELLHSPIEFTELRPGLPTYRLMLVGLGIFFGFVALTDDSARAAHGGLIAAGACLLIAALDWLYDHFPPRPLVQLSSGDPTLVLYADRPSAAAVQEFQASLRRRVQQYLRDTYGNTAGQPLEAIERLFALQQQGALTEAEFQQLKASVLRKSNGGQEPGQYI